LYGAAIADQPKLQEYLRRAYQLGKDFAGPGATPAANSHEVGAALAASSQQSGRVHAR
jgi:hypothetical protein